MHNVVNRMKLKFQPLNVIIAHFFKHTLNILFGKLGKCNSLLDLSQIMTKINFSIKEINNCTINYP